MGEHSMDIEIIQITDPWDFLVRETSKSAKLLATEKFREMHDSMNLYLNQMMEQGFPTYKPAEGEICAVLKREDGAWHRVRVELSQSSSRGQQVNCYMIDEGSQFTASAFRLMKLPKKFCEFPAQIHQCKLWGVQPVTLKLAEGDMGLDAKKSPCLRWDPAAVQFMRRMVEASRQCQAEIVDQDVDNILHLRLYLLTPTGLICFNETLIEREYAISVTTQGEGKDLNENLLKHKLQEKSRELVDEKLPSPPQTSDIPPLIQEHCQSDSGTNCALTIKANNYKHHAQSCPTSSKREDLTPSVQAFFEKAEEYLSSPETQSDKFYPIPRGCEEKVKISLFSSPSESGDTPSKQHQGGLYPGVSSSGLSKLASLSTKQSPNPGVGRGRAMLLPGSSNSKGSQITGRPSMSGDFRLPDEILSSKVAPISAQLSPGLSTDQNVSSSSNLDMTKPLSWGQGSRPKGSKLANSKPGISSNVSKPDTRTSSSDEYLLQLNPVHQTDSADFLKSPKLSTSLASDSESMSSHDGMSSGVRGRYRKSMDRCAESPKQETEKLAQISLSRDAYMRQCQGKRFLETLRKMSGQQQARETPVDSAPVTLRQDQPISRPRFGVVAHGKSVPTLTTDLPDVQFHEYVRQVMEEELGITTAMSIQGYVWPAALSCRHIMGICPCGKGKTMAYVPVLLTHLMDQITYVELPQGKGPLVLVVVPSWKKAKDVYDMVKKFTGSGDIGGRRIRSVVLYAGGMEDSDHTLNSLLQGCEILIATPCSLLRMHDQDFVSLKRLCHIVLDDAEVLATRFAKEVDAIMQLYRLILKDRRCQGVPRQIMIFASQWNNGLEDFRLRFTLQPVIVISSRVEAAVYGGVKQVVVLSKWEQSLTTFCSLLDSLVTTSQRVAAFTSDVAEAVEMWQAAKSRGVYSLLIHEDIQAETIAETREQWLCSSHSKQLMVMVCTDSCYQDLAITNATTVIHYGLPNSKTKFGNRMACMLDYFLDRTSKEQPEVEPISHVILTDKCGPRARDLYEILLRCKSEYSPKLLQFLDGFRMGLENDERKEWCPLLKAFGNCLYQDKCENRHYLMTSQDLKTGELSENSLPASGQIKVKVLHVQCATRYYCHLMEHQFTSTGLRTDLRLDYQKLSMAMLAFFCKETNHVPYVPTDDPFRDGLCAFRDKENFFYRAKVVEVRDGTIQSPMKQCRVWLVDSGCYKCGTIDQLVKLPRRLAEVPYQAVEVYLCNVKPMDDDSEWTDKADMFVHQLVEGKELVGRIMLRVGLTLWLNPLIHQKTYKSVGTTCDFSVRPKILDNKFGTPNSNHMQLLYELCRGKTEIPEELMRQYFGHCLEIELMQETLSSSEDFQSVSIAAVLSPELLYLHRWDRFEALEELESKIAAVLAEKDSQEQTDSSFKLECGAVCLALSADGKWYRAKVVSDCIDGQWEVFFLDYGDREKVVSEAIRPLYRELGELPCQAIECELAYIKPAGEEWTPETVETICDLSYFVSEDKKQLYVKIVDRVEQSYGMGLKFVIDLYDTNAGSVRFSQELVSRHLAVCVDSSTGIKDLVGKPALKNQMFFNPLDKMPYLAANIYWCQDVESSKSQAEELRSLLSIRIRGWDIALSQRAVLSSVIQVIGYIPDDESHGIVLGGLISCVTNSDRLFEVTVTENLTSRLISCLEQVSRPALQHQAAQALAQLLTLNRFCDESFTSDQLVTTLEQFLTRHLNSPVDIPTLKCLCNASAKLVRQPDDSCSAIFRSKEMIDQIYMSLEKARNNQEREPWLELLAAIASWESTHPELMREAHVTQLLDLLSKCVCPKCQFHLLSISSFLATGSRKHKRILLENELLPVLHKLMAAGLQSPALEKCQELQAEMSLHLPQHEKLAGVPAQLTDEVIKVVAPHVIWQQNCFRVVLRMDVRNAKEEDLVIGSNSISCRTTAEGTQYDLDWTLYDSIVPAQTKVTVHESYVLVSLRKEAKGQWSRLLTQKVKPPNLTVDFDHLHDSDEEDVEDADNFSQLTQKKDIFRQEDAPRVKMMGKFYSSDESSDSLAYYSNSDRDEPAVDIESLLLSNRNNNGGSVSQQQQQQQ